MFLPSFFARDYFAKLFMFDRPSNRRLRCYFADLGVWAVDSG